MCPVRNTMWMGTHKGVIKVFHAPTLKKKLTFTLEPEEPGVAAASILDILYVEELRTVLISDFTGAVWSFDDTDVMKSKCRVKESGELGCFHLVKVSEYFPL